MFDVICWSEKLREGPAEGLVHANPRNRKRRTEFLNHIRPAGCSDALPALKRAFKHLRRTEATRKEIFLLTDGCFEGMTGGSRYRSAAGDDLHGNEAVVQWLRDNNRGKTIRVHIILFENKEARAVAVMQLIAKENGGKYWHYSSLRW